MRIFKKKKTVTRKPSSTELSRDNLQTMLANTYTPKSQSGAVGSYEHDTTLSNNRVKVYHDKATNHTVVAHRGSQTKGDWFENALYTVGIRAGANYRHSKRAQKKAEAKYGTANLTTIGHSKGALHAQDFGQHGDVITLNKPVNIHDALLLKVPKNQTDYRGEGDVVSALRGLQGGNKAVTLKKTKEEKPSRNVADYFLKEHGTETLSRSL